ncbi:MAG: ABC transporter permease [Actinobacteria bacterium]|nr:ABC transporter permease [Actinomycetota bacterium]
MHPLLLSVLIFGVPAAIALGWVFLRGGGALRRYIATRVALTLPMVFVLVSVVFLVLRVMPGDVASATLGPKANAEVRQNIEETLGLDDPLVVQYARFLGQVATFDLGDSFVGARRPVVDELGERLPATLELVLPAAGVAIALGLVLGASAAGHRRRLRDYAVRMFGVVVYSMPVFWLGMLAKGVFSIWLGWTPVAGRIDVLANATLERTTNLLVVDSILSGNWEALRSALHHMVLPVLTLGVSISGLFARLVRINVIETLQQDYVAAARARGLRERTVVGAYAVRNAMIPVVTVIGLQVAILLAGTVLTEAVFNWPGMGLYLVERIKVRDFQAVQSAVAMFALLVAAIGLAVDVVYGVLDPRVEY